MAIQETVTANVGSAVAWLNQVAQAEDRITRATRSANLAAKEQQALVRDRIRQQAQLRATAGSVGGSMVGGVIGGGAVGGGFGAAAVGVVALGVAFRSLGQVIQQRIADERQAIQIGQQLRRIQTQARTAEGASAQRGGALAPDLRGLIARGGSVGEAADLADRAAIPLREAIAGLTDIKSLPAALQGAATEAAVRAQQSGFAGFGETARKIATDPLARRDVSGEIDAAAVARIVSRVLGSDVGTGDVILGGRNLLRSRGVDQANEVQRIQNQSTMVDLGRFVGGGAVGVARQELAANVSPSSALMLEFNREVEQTTANLRQLEAATSGFTKVMLALTGQPTPTTELLRHQRVTGQAILSVNDQPPLGGR